MPRQSLKDNIVEAAVETLHRQGFNGSSVQDITDAAGAPKGSFYNHFVSKEELAVAALDRYWARVQTSLVLLADKTIPPKERLLRYFRLLNDAARKNGYRTGCMIGNLCAETADHSPKMREQLTSLLAQWSGAIEGCVREAQADGSIRGEFDPRDVAAFLINAWEGAMLRSKADRSGGALASFERVIAALIA